MQATSKQNPDFINQTEMLNFACAMTGHCSIWLTTIAGKVQFKICVSCFFACMFRSEPLKAKFTYLQCYEQFKKNRKKNDQIGKKYNNN